MTKSNFILRMPEKLEEKFETIDEATEAAKIYLKQNPKLDKVVIHEVIDTELGKKGRLILKVGENFYWIDTEWIS